MLDRADPDERARVRAALEDGTLSPPAIDEIRRLVLKHAGVEYALDRAHAYARAAKADLAPFPASEERETLALVAEFVVDRDR
jgi:octaprenyl-diphosphate synthase